jgi:hypothetical protein
LARRRLLWIRGLTLLAWSLGQAFSVPSDWLNVASSAWKHALSEVVMHTDQGSAYTAETSWLPALGSGSNGRWAGPARRWDNAEDFISSTPSTG